MDLVEDLAKGVYDIDELLDESVLEPDPARTDWPKMARRLRLVEDCLDHEVLDALPAALAFIDDPEMRARIERRVAELTGSVATLLLASGNTEGGNRRIGQAIAIAPEGETRAELEAAQAEPQVFAKLRYGRWLLRHGRGAPADKAFKAALRSTRAPALRKAAKRGFDAPHPITGTAPLFRLNGCGAGLYGRRDRWPDGAYVATYCVTLLWVPVLPLTAYRVRAVGGSRYHFTTRERLGPIARAWRALVLTGAIAAGGYFAVSSYLESPTRRAQVALAEAEKTEAKGDLEGAASRYRTAVNDFPDAPGAVKAADAVVRLSLGSLPDPCTISAVDEAGRAVNAFYALPGAARRGAPTARLLQRLDTCAEQIGEATPAHAEATLALLDIASRVAEGEPSAAPIQAKRERLTRGLAEKLAADRPLQALALFTRLGSEPIALGKARAILESFDAAPSLWLEAEPEVEAWLREAESAPAERGPAAAIRKRLEAARTAHAADAALIEGGDEKAISVALAKAAPHNQELTTALANIERRRGEVEGAIKRLRGLGAPGRMTAAARQLLGACLADAGQLAQADDVLTGLVDERLPAFQQAQREYSGEAERVRRRVFLDIDADNAPPDLERAMNNATEDKRPEILRAWLTARVDADPSLDGLRAEYMRRAAVVPPALALSVVKLRRAGEATGDERKTRLAEAERAFLAIRREAAGDPSFHLGLGQVYHRLGRPADGDAEIERVLARKAPELTLAAIKTYRDLGIHQRARAITEQLYEEAAEPEPKQQAAIMMAHLVRETGDEEAEATWLKRSDQGAPVVKNLLIEVDARRLVRDGKLAEGERLYAQIAASYASEGKHDSSGANNAALAQLERYHLTGDPPRLRDAVKNLDEAARLAPESAIVAGNLADALEYQGNIAVLERWVRMRTLLLQAGDATRVLDALLASPQRDEVIAAMRRDPSLRRSLDKSQDEQTLAPQKASGFARQARFLEATGDEKGIGDLEKRIDALPPLDTGGERTARADFESKAKDEVNAELQVNAVAAARARLARAQPAGHGPTIATAWMLLGDELVRLAFFKPTEAMLDEAIEAQRKAVTAWPEGGFQSSLVEALLLAAVHRGAAESPALRKLYDEELRVYALPVLVDRAIGGGSGAEILAALRRRPEVAEATLVLKKARAGRKPSLLDVAFAELSGDAALEPLAMAAFARPELGLELSLDSKLSPGQRREQGALELFRRGALRK